MKKYTFILATLVALFAMTHEAKAALCNFDSQTNLNGFFTTSQTGNNAVQFEIVDVISVFTPVGITPATTPSGKVLKITMGGDSKNVAYLTTANQQPYQNVRQINFWFGASDKGKTYFAVEQSADKQTWTELIPATALKPGASYVYTPTGKDPSNTTLHYVQYNCKNAQSGYFRVKITQPTSGKIAYLENFSIVNDMQNEIKNTDATLQSITVKGTPIPGFTPTGTSYNVTLPAGSSYPKKSDIVGTPTDEDAYVEVTTTPTVNNNGKAVITVTAADDETTKTYTIYFTIAQPVLSSNAVLGSVTIGTNTYTAADFDANRTLNYTIPYSTSGYTIPTVGATADENGTASVTQASTTTGTAIITVQSEDGTAQAFYTVQFSEGQPILSGNVVLGTITVGSTTYTASDFDANRTLTYTIPYSTSGYAIPTVSATADDNGTILPITQATSSTGQVIITVQSQDGQNQLSYTIQLAEEPAPVDNNFYHEPEVYETPVANGGWGTALTPFQNREYEVFYFSKHKPNGSDIGALATANNLIDGMIISEPTGTGNRIFTDPEWFVSSQAGGMEGDTYKAQAYTSSGKAAKKDEFQTCPGDIKMQGGDTMVLYIKGYDMFRFYAADNEVKTNSDGDRFFSVYIDGVKQAYTPNKTATIREFAISQPAVGHKILVTIHSTGSSNCKLFGFSLRTAFVPKLKHITGPLQQSVRQTEAIDTVTFYLKNHINDATLRWLGTPLAGVSLLKGTSDTLYLVGPANGQNGTYDYVIEATDENGTIVTDQKGSITVTTAIEAANGQKNDQTLYQRSAMTDMTWHYYALSSDSVEYSWAGGTAPAGLTFQIDASTQTLTLSGTPTGYGIFTYTVSVKGGNSISGTLTIESNDPTIVDPNAPTVLYLFKNHKESGLFNYLKTRYNYLARPAAQKIANTAEYAAYDVIIIASDVDATSGEALQVIDSLHKPVLNMQIHTYSVGRLNWGDPYSCSKSTNTIHVQQPSHPIFQGLGSDIKLLEKLDESGKGLMIADVTKQSTFSLANAPKRAEDAQTDPDNATFIHEVPVAVRGAKYLTLPIAEESTPYLTATGKRLFDQMIQYLVSPVEAPLSVPDLEIISFVINNISGIIDNTAHRIEVFINDTAIDLTTLTPTITLKDPNGSWVYPEDKVEQDFSDSWFGVRYTVTDGINKMYYDAVVRIPRTSQGNRGDDDEEGEIWNALVEIPAYRVGDTFTLYDVRGRKLLTSSDNLYTLRLPHGIYILRTNAGTIKIMR